jgi:hypothetical protein
VASGGIGSEDGVVADPMRGAGMGAALTGAGDEASPDGVKCTLPRICSTAKLHSSRTEIRPAAMETDNRVEPWAAVPVPNPGTGDDDDADDDDAEGEGEAAEPGPADAAEGVAMADGAGEPPSQPDAVSAARQSSGGSNNSESSEASLNLAHT